MNLGLAGMISGAGEAGTKAIASAQTYLQASSLQAERDKMDNLRQERLLGHTEKMQAEKIAAEAQQNQLNREQQSKEGMLNRENATENIGQQITSHEAMTGQEITSKEKISGDENKVRLEMNDATNRTHLLTAKLERQMQEKHFDKTFTASKLDALKHTIQDLGNEITRLSVVVGNPLADKTDPNYQAAVLQLTTATQLHNLYSKHVGMIAGIAPDDITGATKPTSALPPFRSPTQSSTPAPTHSGGMIQVPAPSSVEQEMMRKSIER